MDRFTYSRASELQELKAAVADNAHILAGGTEVLNWLRLGAETANHMIDISDVAALSGISMEGDMLTFGALTTVTQLERSPEIQQHFPGLVQACRLSASPQIRNRATLGGNILQRSRCAYFRAEAKSQNRLPWACNKRAPGTGCSVELTGLHPKAALFGGTSECHCTNPTDPIAALAAANAHIHLDGPNGARDMPVTSFLLTQNEVRKGDAEIERLLSQKRLSTEAGEAVLVNRLAPGEIITHYSLPLDDATRNSAYVKVRERQSYEYALVAAAACIKTDGDTITEARIALGSVAQKPWRLPVAEKALIGTRLEKDAILAVLEQDLSDAAPLPGQDYRVTLARRAAARAILKAGGQADE